jgi:hypothetical protein
LRGTQATPQESESRSDDSLEEIHQRSTSSISVNTQMYQSVTLIEDVDDLAEEHQLMGDTSIFVLGVVDLHVEVDPAAHPRSMMWHESTGDDMSMPKHIVMSDSSQRNVEMYDEILKGYSALQGGDTPRGVCRCHSFATKHSRGGSPSPFQQLHER